MSCSVLFLVCTLVQLPNCIKYITPVFHYFCLLFSIEYFYYTLSLYIFCHAFPLYVESPSLETLILTSWHTPALKTSISMDHTSYITLSSSRFCTYFILLFPSSIPYCLLACFQASVYFLVDNPCLFLFSNFIYVFLYLV